MSARARFLTREQVFEDGVTRCPLPSEPHFSQGRAQSAEFVDIRAR